MPEVQPTLSIWNKTFDKELQLADGVTAVTPSAGGVQGVVAAANKVVTLGAGVVGGELVVDLQAIDTGTGDERYLLVLQGADDAAFTTGLRALAVIILGDSTLNFGSADSPVGRYVARWSNSVYRGATFPAPAKYARILAVGVAGTIGALSFDYHAYLTIDHVNG